MFQITSGPQKKRNTVLYAQSRLHNLPSGSAEKASKSKVCCTTPLKKIGLEKCLEYGKILHLKWVTERPIRLDGILDLFWMLVKIVI